MKLLVCDIEGTIFQPHMIKSAQHASYIWTAIAEALGKDAEREEINTQKKWRNSGYGMYDTGAAYMRWVNESILIHKKYGLTETVFDHLIRNAPYIAGVERFFKQLNRKEYIPVFISGGIQNLNHKACADLGVDVDDSYASCEYFFDSNGELDSTLTFQNTCNFYGKHELIKVALKKHGLGAEDWVFIGDGINDVSVASTAPLSIGISPIEELRDVIDYSFADFSEMIDNSEFIEHYHLLSAEPFTMLEISTDECNLRQQSMANVAKQIGQLPLDNLEKRAFKRYRREMGDTESVKYRERFFGIKTLLEQGEYVLTLLEKSGEQTIASAVLQPFCSAAEIMVNVTLSLRGKNEELHNLVNSENTFEKAINRIENQQLKDVLHAYRQNRNSIAHSCHMIPIKAACSLARRTYENIQRLELIASSVE